MENKNTTQAEIALLMSQKAILEQKIKTLISEGVKEELCDKIPLGKFQRLEALLNNISTIEREVNLLSMRPECADDSTENLCFTVNFTITKKKKIK